ncbi:MAG TPA: hypothetical protein VGG39_28610 [Polyangiaceae bacterium]|jgi:hypothetical protein
MATDEELEKAFEVLRETTMGILDKLLEGVRALDDPRLTADQLRAGLRLVAESTERSAKAAIAAMKPTTTMH